MERAYWGRSLAGKAASREVEPEKFYIGLLTLIRAIERDVIGAGAMLGHRSLKHQRLPRGAALPERMTITLVPLNGPRVDVDFDHAEIKGCAGGVVPECVGAKVDGYVTKFLSFRNGAVRSIRKARQESF